MQVISVFFGADRVVARIEVEEESERMGACDGTGRNRMILVELCWLATSDPCRQLRRRLMSPSLASICPGFNKQTTPQLHL
jgi:hypothetical protein